MPKVSKTKYVSWDERFKELEQYKQQNGNCDVPQKHPKLGKWVNTNRTKYKNRKLSEERIKLLNGIGFEWVRHKIVGWDERFEQLKGYKQVIGHCNVPQGYEANPQLASWVHTNRTKYKNGKLSKEHIESLQGIGFEWKLKEKLCEVWDEMFKQLQEYKEQYGHCRVPTKYTANPQLGYWVSKQRSVYNNKRKGKLSPEQINRLERLGFKWIIGRGNWQTAREVSESEGSTSGGEEETGGATSSRDIDTQTISLRRLPPIVWQAQSLASGDEDAEHDDNGSSFEVDKQYGDDGSSFVPMYQGHNQQGDAGEVELVNDGTSFHMDEEDDHQEDDGEETDDSGSPTNVSPATEQEGGRSSLLESQQDLKQKLDEANAQIALLLQPDIVDLTNEDSIICEDNQKESAGTKSVEAAVYAVCKIKKEKLDEADKKIAAAEEKVAAAEKRAELAEKRASLADCRICLQAKGDMHAIVACGHSLCFDCYWELKKLRCPFCNGPIEPVKQKLKRLY